VKWKVCETALTVCPLSEQCGYALNFAGSAYQVRQDEGCIEKSFGIAVLAYLFLIRVCRDDLRTGQSWNVAHLKHTFGLGVINNQVENDVKAKLGKGRKAA